MTYRERLIESLTKAGFQRLYNANIFDKAQKAREERAIILRKRIERRERRASQNKVQRSNVVKCRDLMIGDWIQDKHGFRFYIVGIGEDYAYATFEENEGDLWEFDNEIEPCYGIPLDEVREQVEAVTEITAEFDYLHEFQQYLRVTGQREEANKIKL